MKILMVTEHFFPASKGGTEQYVLSLANGLINLGHEVMVLSSHIDKKQDTYQHISIRYITAYKADEKKVIQGLLPPPNIQEFSEALFQIQPHLVHFHTISTNIGHFHLEEAKKKFKTIYTSHIPNDLCIKGDLVKYNGEVCDGKVKLFKCSKCAYLSSKKKMSDVYSFITNSFPGTLSAVYRKQQEIRKIADNVDSLVVVSHWQKEYWLRNIAITEKLKICRQAVPPLNSNRIEREHAKSKVVFAFVGRISKHKGLHLLIEAFKMLDDDDTELHIAAIPSANEIEYLNTLKQGISDKIFWQENLNNVELEEFYSKIDYLVIPSLWLETGPYVAYEAMIRKIPIIATPLGGLVELIRDGENGYFFSASSDSLLAIMKKLISEPLVINDHGIIRTNDVLALEMETCYKNLIQSDTVA